MITVQVENVKKQWGSCADLDENWVFNELQSAGQRGNDVCVMVTIDEGEVNMLMKTSGCPTQVGYAGTDFNQTEEHVRQLWRESGINRGVFDPDRAREFFRKLRRIVESASYVVLCPMPLPIRLTREIRFYLWRR